MECLLPCLAVLNTSNRVSSACLGQCQPHREQDGLRANGESTNASYFTWAAEEAIYWESPCKCSFLTFTRTVMTIEANIWDKCCTAVTARGRDWEDQNVHTSEDRSDEDNPRHSHKQNVTQKIFIIMGAEVYVCVCVFCLSLCFCT